MATLKKAYSQAVVNYLGIEDCEKLAELFEQDYHKRGKCLFSSDDNKVYGFVDEKKGTLELSLLGEPEAKALD